MLNLPVFLGKKMPTIFRCYQMKRSKDAHEPKKFPDRRQKKKRGFSSRNYLGLFLADLDFFAIFCQASCYRTRFQASSGISDSANWPGYEAVETHNTL